MDNKKNSTGFIILTLVVYISFIIFLVATDSKDFGLNKVNELGWKIGRLLTVSFWVTLAYVFYIKSDKYFSKESFRKSLIPASVLSFALTTIIAGPGGTILSYGSAIYYTLITGLLCSSTKKDQPVVLLSIGLTTVQIVIDIIILSIAGDFRFH